MTKKDIKNSYSKICGIAYEKKDITRIVKFAKKHKLNYFYIKHKKEIDEKKNHYHFIIEGDSYHRFNIGCLISDTLTVNLFQKCSSVDAYLRYMLHIDYVDKIHYTTCNIISNLIEKDLNIRINYDDRSKTEINYDNFTLILTLINVGTLSSLADIFQFCCDNDIKYLQSWTFTFVQFLKKV